MVGYVDLLRIVNIFRRNSCFAAFLIIYISSVTNAHLININHPQCLSQRPLFLLNFQLKDEAERIKIPTRNSVFARKSLVVSPESFQGNQNMMFKDTQTTPTFKSRWIIAYWTWKRCEFSIFPPSKSPLSGNTRFIWCSLSASQLSNIKIFILQLLNPLSLHNFNVSCFCVFSAAFQHVRDNLSDLENAANETDLVFLKGLLDNPAVKEIIKVGQHSTFLADTIGTQFHT